MLRCWLAFWYLTSVLVSGWHFRVRLTFSYPAKHIHLITMYLAKILMTSQKFKMQFSISLFIRSLSSSQYISFSLSAPSLLRLTALPYSLFLTLFLSIYIFLSISFFILCLPPPLFYLSRLCSLHNRWELDC